MEGFFGILLLIVIVAYYIISAPQRRVIHGKNLVQEHGPFTYSFTLAGIKEQERTITLFDIGREELETIGFDDIKSYKSSKMTRGYRDMGSQFYFTVKNHARTSYTVVLESPEDEQFGSALELVFENKSDAKE